MGDDGRDYISEKAPGLSHKVAELVLSATDVDALKPVCVGFRALFDVVKEAGKNGDDLIGLIDYGILRVKSMTETGTVSSRPR